MAFALTFSGQFEDIERICSDVIDFGHKVGNNRCIAFGMQALGMMHLGLGNFERAIALAEEASATAKDPMYRDTAKSTLVCAASLLGDLETARAAVAYLRQIVDSGVQLPSPFFIDVGDALVMTGSGDLSDGMALLETTMELAAETSRYWEWLFGRTIEAVFLARIASGELSVNVKTLVRNPRFLPYVRRARSSAEQELSAVREDAYARTWNCSPTSVTARRPSCSSRGARAAKPACSWCVRWPSPIGAPRGRAPIECGSYWRGSEDLSLLRT